MSIRRVVSIDQAEWIIAPPGEWIEAREPDWSFDPVSDAPIAVLLYDQQHHVASRAVSNRTVRRLLTANAVQSLGQVELDFDPAAHRLVIHELAVWRQGADGRWEKRSHARREVFLLRQREQQLERQILNGRVSLVPLLEDVRIGDAIDLWWSLEACDALPGLHFTAFCPFVWQVPVARALFTLHLSPAHPVTWRMHAPAGASVPASELLPHRAAWKIENPPTRAPEPNAPPGDWPFAVLDVSGWTSWGDVARFFADFWSEGLAHGAETVREEAMRLGAGLDPARAALAVIHFVQEEIRYLALDFGEGGGILPDGAGNVLRRRFGDCKDKSVLLTALLRHLGIDASPLLVAPNWREALAELQPSTAAFSHAIVTFTVGGKRYFADPTEVGRGGDLDRMVAPPLGYGLEIRPETEGLLRIPDLPPAELTLTETFVLDRKSRSGSCEQVLSASAWVANRVREALVRGGKAAFFKHRAEELQRHFPALTPTDDAPTVSDDLDANAIELRAAYSLPTWGKRGGEPPDRFEYGAHGLFLVVETLDESLVRRQPWMLPFPLKAHHRVIVRGKCVSPAPPETFRINGFGFHYECMVSAQRNEVAIDYRWETTQATIAPHEWPSYRRDRNRAFEHASANIVTEETPSHASPKLGWLWFVVGLLLVGGVTRFAEWVRTSEARAAMPRSRAAIERPSDLPVPTVDLRPALEAARRGDYATAAPLVEAARSLYAKDFDYQLLRVDVLLHTGRLGLARQSIEVARRMDGTSALRDGLEGLLLEAEGDLAGARANLERAHLRAPGSVSVLDALARVTEALGDANAAQQARGKADALMRERQ